MSNELGTILCGTNWPTDKTLIGHKLLDNDELVLFFFDPAPLRPDHEIGIFNTTNCTYTTIVTDSLLNFSDKYPINALFRIRNGCERIIYFTDNYNPYRVINITDTSDWVTSGGNLVDHNKILFTRAFAPPVVNVPAYGKVIRDSAGNLEYGSYSFYFRYLDVDQNPTFDWLPISHYISIGKGSQTNATNNLLYGASNVSDSPNFADRSNKAINLLLTSLDTTFKYYQIAVLKRTSESGAVSGVDVLFPFPITSSTDEFTYTGFDSQIFSQTSTDEILNSYEPIYKVKAHAIEDRKLFLAGLTSSGRDYSLYQRYASAIKVTYQATKVDERQSKKGSIQLFGETLCPDEIYALGIVYVHSDGTESPPFPIPGRPMDVDMTGHTHPYISSYTNWDSDNIIGDPNVFDDTKTDRWQVFSTATIETATSTAISHKGYLGYYQTTTTYPDITACDGESYWGQDWAGNDITSSDYIRHHRMPGQYMYVGAGQASYPQYDINLTFDNVNLPDDVVSWYIVYGDRSEERTVLDRGFLRTMNWDDTDEVTYHAHIDWDSTILNDDDTKWNYTSFVSPTTVYKSQAYSGDYVSLEKVLETSSTTASEVDPVGGITVEVNEFDASIVVDTSIYEYTVFDRPERLNYIVNSSTLINKVREGLTTVLPTTSNSYFVQSSTGDRIENRSLNHDIGFYELNDYIQELDNFGISCGGGECLPDGSQDFFGIVATVKANRDVFENLYSINYKKLHPNRLNSTPVTIVAGDQFIPYFDTLEMYYENSAPDARFTTTPIVHDLNTELRYYSEAERGKYTWYRYSGGYEHSPLARHVAFKYYEVVADEGIFYPEYYYLSDKYNYNTPDDVYLPIPFNYEFCNDCIEDHPYRIYYSDTDDEETSNDKLRIIRANNYSSIEGEDGPITDLFSVQNQLYLTTANSILRIPIKAQSIQTNEAGIYIGAAETLSLPFYDLHDSEYALGGLPNFKGRIITEFGGVYVDPKSSRVYLINNQLNDLSSNGLRNFWKENGELSYPQQYFQLTNLEYEYDSLTSPNGVGYIITFDPRYKRVIIHKRDYEILPEYTSNFTYDTSNTDPVTLWFDGTDYHYNTEAEGTTVDVTFGDPIYFRDKSFTVSYSFITNSWVSFHSYFPYYFFNTHNSFFSDGPYKHNVGDFQNYYGTKYPHIIDLIAVQNPYDGKLSQAVYYTSRTDEYNLFHREYEAVNATFDGLIAYNSRQSSSYQPVTLKTNPFQVDIGGSLLVDYIDSKFRLNDLRDLTVSNTDPI